MNYFKSEMLRLDPKIGYVSQDPAYLAVGNAAQLKSITGMDIIQYLSDPQGLNSYSYARNNPLVYTDPTGEFFGQFGIDMSNSQRSIAQSFYNLGGYLNNQGIVGQLFGAKQLGMASNIAGSIADNVANILDPRQGADTRLFAVGMVGLDVGSGGEGRGVGKILGKVGDIVHINPEKIRFTQDSISSKFSNGNTLESTINGLKSGKISPNDFPPIRVFERDEKMYSLDNRRLEVFQKAGIDIPTIRATSQEIKNELVRKFTTFNDGKSIIVR